MSSSPKEETEQPLNRILSTDEILESGTEFTVTVSPEESDQIAQLLELSDLETLTCKAKLREKAKGRIALEGILKARFTQNCVVSLEPINSDISETIEAEFWPEEQIAELMQAQAQSDDAIDIEPLAAEGPDPIINGKIDIGQIVYETFATLVEPYPRAPGAVFDWDNASTAEDDGKDPSENPFAVLETLKKNS